MEFLVTFTCASVIACAYHYQAIGIEDYERVKKELNLHNLSIKDMPACIEVKSTERFEKTVSFKKARKIRAFEHQNKIEVSILSSRSRKLHHDFLLAKFKRNEDKKYRLIIEPNYEFICQYWILKGAPALLNLPDILNSEPYLGSIKLIN